MQTVEGAGRRRVAITGRGVVSPAGNTPEEFWKGITRGNSVVGKLTRFDGTGLDVQIAGEVDLGERQKDVPKTMLRGPDLTIQFGLLAAKDALEEAGLIDAARKDLRIGALVGSGLGPCHTLGASYAIFDFKGRRGVRPTTVPRCMYNGIVSEASIIFHLTGCQHVVAAACASASHAMSHAYDAIVMGREDVVLTGGCDSPLTDPIYTAWVNLRVLSDTQDPTKAMRPFDKTRNGLALAEGAGMFVFEEMEHARARGATIYGEFLGYGTSSDAVHVTKPDADGQTEALRQALKTSGLTPDDVDYINAHGTSTVLNDVTETAAIKQTFGDRAYKIPISSTKSVVGHSMGASAAMEVLAILKAMEHQTLPPTVNLEVPDPECDLDYVPCEPRPGRVKVGLSNSFAFGGSNSVLALRAYEE